jgi:hypothetical protein
MDAVEPPVREEVEQESKVVQKIVNEWPNPTFGYEPEIDDEDVPVEAKEPEPVKYNPRTCPKRALHPTMVKCSLCGYGT